jgi:hypothetical protein
MVDLIAKLSRRQIIKEVPNANWKHVVLGPEDRRHVRALPYLIDINLYCLFKILNKSYIKYLRICKT